MYNPHFHQFLWIDFLKTLRFWVLNWKKTLPDGFLHILQDKRHWSAVEGFLQISVDECIRYLQLTYVSTHSDELVFFVVVCSIVGIFVVVILMGVVWAIPGKTGEIQMNEIMALRHYKVKKFWIDQFSARNSEKVWTDSEHSEHWLKILNILNIDWKFWTFWTLTEHSEQILNILNIVWTESEHCLKSLNILRSVW
jgi:hypothetical protein